MTLQAVLRQARRSLAGLAAAMVLTAGALALGAAAPAGGAEAKAASGAAAKAALPCDIYASGGTPCVAAHSTTRALYASYNGPLYQVKRSSDGATATIGTLNAGGYANAAAQDSFCAGTACTITEIYDQSGHGNNLTIGPAGGADPADIGANAAALPTTAGGHKVYGVFISPGMGYRADDTSGIATGDQPEGEYAVLGGTHDNDGCCFDYGNAETNNDDNGAGHMEAIYFGTATGWGTGSGSGPWIMADMENGLFSGQGSGINESDPSVSHGFVTAVIKGEPGQWAIRGGNAQSGKLSTYYSGARPSGYNPMSKEGAIILGVGGDNSHSSAGSFYEGVMTSGYPSDATENAVQSSITSAGYSSSNSTPFAPGKKVSIQATAPGSATDYVTHDDSDNKVVISNVTSSSSAAQKADATWDVVPGLANRQCVSFESANDPGAYLRHSNYELYVNTNDGSTLFANDATFCPRAGNSGSGYSMMSNNFSDHYFRNYNGTAYIASDGGPNPQDAAAGWPADTTWKASAPWG
ncbi:MAG: alpha-L-arabinofuranosidase B [Streptosporangiales bacterium]|nr:alpha-L-arabinofuranosidase B [Streptosporangiales bacterium]